MPSYTPPSSLMNPKITWFDMSLARPIGVVRFCSCSIQSLNPSGSRSNESPLDERALLASFHDNLAKHEAKMRRFRLQAKHKRAKRAKSLRNKRPGTTSKGGETKPPAGTKPIAGDSMPTATDISTTTVTERFWLASRTCSHCQGLGLWSKGSWGECVNCHLFTDLRL